jgi:hypothetical protein
MSRIRHTSWGLFVICLTRALRLSAVASLFAAWAIAAVGPEPNFYARRDYSHNPGCAGTVYLAVGDINNDGIPDIVCNGQQFLFGKGNGTFILSPLYSNLDGASPVLLDINGDGDLDIVEIYGGGAGWGFKVALGNGDGTFQSPTSYAVSDEETNFLAVGDFNGDGIPDAVTVGDRGVWLMTGKGGGLFNKPVLAVTITANPFSMFGAADVNNDGKLDLVLSTQPGFSVLLGNNNGTFQPPVNYTGTGVNDPTITIADVNSDGYLDVVCASVLNNSEAAIYLGEAGGKFREPYFVDLPNYLDIEVGDVNGDGIPDLVSDSVYIAYGLGHNRFSTPVYFPLPGSPTSATQVVLAHLRNDKDVDLVANSAFTTVSVLLNKGNGSYIEGITTSFPSGLGCGNELDFNNDGIADLGFLSSNNFVVEYGTGKVSAPFTTGPSSAVPQNTGYSLNCPSNFGDINGDGIPDMLMPEINSAGSETLLVPFFGTGNGNYTAGTPFSTPQNNGNAFLADVNGDSKADLITPTLNEIWYGNGDGTFQAPVQLASGVTLTITDVAAADLNGDGVTDLVVQIEDGQGTILLESNGSGGLTQTNVNVCAVNASCLDTFAVGLGDLNGDGAPDLVLGNNAVGSVAVFINDGKGNFTFQTALKLDGLLEAPAPGIVDLNGDGLNEIAVSDGTDIGVLTNEGNLTFKQALYFGQTSGAYYFGNWHGQSATSGFPDVMMPGSGSITMLLNETK